MKCLLLQKPHAKSKAKEHSIHLERRLKLWRDGNIDDLFQEGRCIQIHLVSLGIQTPDPGKTVRVLNRLMLQGKVNVAMRLVTRDANRGVLSLDDLIPIEIGQNGEPIQKMKRDILLEKHPSQQQMTHYWT